MISVTSIGRLRWLFVSLTVALLALMLVQSSSVNAQATQTTIAETPRNIASSIALTVYKIDQIRDAATEAYVQSWENSFRADLMLKPGGSLILSQNAKPIAAGVAAVREEVRRQYTATVTPRVTSAVVDIYERNFSLKELIAIRAYHLTPQAQALAARYRPGQSDTSPVDPVVKTYQESTLGRREQRLLPQITVTISNTNIEAMRSLQPVVQQTFEAAIDRHMAGQRR